MCPQHSQLSLVCFSCANLGLAEFIRMQTTNLALTYTLRASTVDPVRSLGDAAAEPREPADDLQPANAHGRI